MFQSLYNKLFKTDTHDLINDAIDDEINKVIDDIKYLPNIEKLNNIDKNIFYTKLVKVYPASFQYIDQKYHTLEMCENIVNKIPEFIKYTKYQTVDMCKKAIYKKPYLIKYAIYKTPNMINKAIDYDHTLIQNIENQTLDICRKVVSKDPYYFKFTKIQDLEMCKYACSTYPQYIKLCNIVDEELALIVVAQDPYLIKYINKSIQTKKIAIQVLNNPILDITAVLKYIRTDILKSMDITVLYDFIYKNNEYNLNSPCCICLDDYIDGEILTNTICNHCYHKKCLDDWLAIQNFCPMCNNIVV